MAEGEQQLRSLTEIITEFPPKKELFPSGNKKIIAEVSRDLSGKILFVVPGSARFEDEILESNNDGSEGEQPNSTKATPPKFPVRRFRPATLN